MSADREAERTTIKTTIPPYQKDEWKRHADELDMSQAEFVRAMVQAGRKGFEFEGLSESWGNVPEKDGEGGVTPGGNGLEERILELLEDDGPQDWDQIIAGLTDGIEERLEEALDELQRSNHIQYSSRKGGYVVIDDGR